MSEPAFGSILPAFLIHSETYTVTIIDMEGRYVYASPLFLRRYARLHPTFTGEHYSIGIHPDDLDACQTAAAACIHNRDTPSKVHLRKNTGDGTGFHWTEWEISLLKPAEGMPAGFICIGHDIENERSAVTRLQSSEDRYRSIISTMQEGILIRDMNGIIVSCNKSAETILQTSFDQIIGRRSVNDAWISIREDGQVISGYDHPAMETIRTRRPVYDFVLGIVRPNLQVTWISISTQLLYDPGNSEEPFAVYSIFHDITTRKQAEEEAVAWSHRLEDIISGTHIGTWEWNIQTGEMIVNARWAEIIGYTLEELQPVNVQLWNRITHPDDVARGDTLIEAHFNGKAAYYDLECRMRHKNGHWIWVLDRGKVSKWSKEGKPLIMSGTHQDITDRKQAEAKIIKQNEKLRQIAYDQSHVLRKPIASMLGLCDLIQRELARNNLHALPEYLAYLHQSAEEADRAIHAIVDKTKEI